MPPPYPSTAVSAAHPARLAAAAILRGVRAGFSERFRYLELGCGDASNLLPLAAQFPEARFVGVDRDAGLIERGADLGRRAGLGNVELFAADVRAFEPPGDAYDYVVAHGVYSWVPPEVQRRLLEICAGSLSLMGVAYLSYNTLPGWGLRGVVRDMMRAAAEGAPDDEAAVRAAKGALARLQRHVTAPQHPYAALLSLELGLARAHPDGYLLREHLAEINEPLYFRELSRRAAEHGLSYLAEMLPATPDGGAELSVLPDLEASGLSRVDAEQHLDVVSYRQFRATLFCREGAGAADAPDHARLGERAYFAGKLVPTSEEPLLGPGRRLGFRAPTGAVVEADRPLLKAALLVLAEAWPEGLRAPHLVSAAMTVLRHRGLLEQAAVDAAEVDRTVDDLLALCQRRLLELLPWSPRPERDPSARPAVSALCRLEAARSPFVTSPWHEPLPLDDATRVVVRLLDGSRDLDRLARDLRGWLDSGELTLPDEAAAALDGASLADLAQAAIGHVRSLGLLVRPAAEAPGGLRLPAAGGA